MKACLKNVSQTSKLLPRQMCSPRSTSAASVSVNFDDTKASFEHRSTKELLQAYLVLRACQVKLLTKNARRLYNLGNMISPSITESALRKTFFGHFCAGTDQDTIVPTVNKLKDAGIGAILDYAAEADVSEQQEDDGGQASLQAAEEEARRIKEQVNNEPKVAWHKRPRPQGSVSSNWAKAASDSMSQPSSFLDPSFNRPSAAVRDRMSARMYDYEGEAQCDANVEIFKSCIETAARQDDGFAAIKMTALGKPELLQHVTTVIHEARRSFRTVVLDQKHTSLPSPINAVECGWGEQITNAFYLNSAIEKEDFVNYVLRDSNLMVNEEQALAQFAAIDKDGNGSIDFHEWLDSLDLQQLGSAKIEKFHRTQSLSDKELAQLDAMIERCWDLGEFAASRKVNLMVDAEQTYMQPAIDHMVLLMQRAHNKEVGYIYNTYQCYLQDSMSRVAIDFLRSQREGFKFAAKVVRGAYMFQERDRAAELGYKDPIQPSLAQTHSNYNAIVRKLIAEVPTSKCRLMIASHNEKSIKSTVEQMGELGITENVYFGQLLGMCDHVTYALGRNNFKVNKYVPYGPVDEVMPYLIRRAEENSDLLGGSVRECKLLKAELRSRMFGF